MARQLQTVSRASFGHLMSVQGFITKYMLTVLCMAVPIKLFSALPAHLLNINELTRTLLREWRNR